MNAKEVNAIEKVVVWTSLTRLASTEIADRTRIARFPIPHQTNNAKNTMFTFD
jgi:hypothetical protein